MADIEGKYDELAIQHREKWAAWIIQYKTLLAQKPMSD
jgi:hypothetical protein